MLDALRDARRLVILTGAGMSAESSIPTYRDAINGFWVKFNPLELGSPAGWAADRGRVWAWSEWRRGLMQQAQPNSGHLAISKLTKALMKASGHDVTVDVITQNVDDLHERAGSKHVLHLHVLRGSTASRSCLVRGGTTKSCLAARRAIGFGLRRTFGRGHVWRGFPRRQTSCNGARG